MNATRARAVGACLHRLAWLRLGVVATIGLLLTSGLLAVEPFDSVETVQPVPDSTIAVTGSIGEADGWVAYGFTAPATGLYRIGMIAQNSTLDPTLELYDERGRLLRRNDNAAASTLDSRLRSRLAAGETRYVLTGGKNGTIGEYKLTITIEPRDDAGNALEEARALRLSQGRARIAGVLDYDGDDDVFCFVTPNAAPMALALAGAKNDSAFDGGFRLYDASGGELFGDGSQFSIDVGQEETYYVEVAGTFAQVEDDNRYRLSVHIPVDKVGNTAPEATEIRLRRGKGRARSDIAFDWDVDFYSVVAVTSLPMIVDLSPPAQNADGFDGQITIYDSSANPIATHDDPQSGGAHLSVDPVEGETYYIRVAGVAGSTGRYVLAVRCTIDDHGDTMNDASKMRWDDGVYGRRGCIDYAGDIDVFRLVATRAGQMRVRVRTFGRDNPLQPAFIVCDNLGGQTAQDVADAQDGRANANCQVAEGHAYFIAVTDAGDDAIGRYAVRARIRKHAAANGDDDDEEPEPEPEDLPAWVEPVDNSSALTGYVTHDIVIDTETDWLSAQMVVELTAGTIYQDPFGTNISPNPLFFPTVPTLEFDTYVSNGTLGGSVSTTSAPDLDPGAPIQFDTSRISIGWFTTGTEIGELALARITLSDNAAGTWQFRATASPATGGPSVHLTGTIADGVMIPD